MQSGFFVFEKVADAYMPPVNRSTRSELKEYLNARLNEGLKAEDFLIIRGRQENISAVKIVAEFETAEN